MELAVYNINGEKTDRTVELSDSIFGIEPNDHAIYLDVKLIMANRRQGTHMSKERGFVAGSTRKIKRQKGTGTARAGSIKSPVFRGGGRVFGPRPRDYSFKLNKKVKRLARKSALSYKASTENITVLEDFNFDAPRTKEFLKLLKSFELTDKKVLFVMPETVENVYLSTRNLKKVKYLNSNNLNTYDVLNANRLILVESTIKDLDELFSN
ncbi:MAG: 50S ribosomal protein L4 [Bacteroidales bacterium]|nr:50S ribosomal protein L4 [Bacteroidales bacterium]